MRRIGIAVAIGTLAGSQLVTAATAGGGACFGHAPTKKLTRVSDTYTIDSATPAVDGRVVVIGRGGDDYITVASDLRDVAIYVCGQVGDDTIEAAPSGIGVNFDGGNGHDDLRGTNEPDVLRGGKGSDSIQGGAPGNTPGDTCSSPSTPQQERGGHNCE